jgi:NADH-quinone oxidoreductase subunit E
MVARRLADESVQPTSFAFSAENAKWAEWRIGLYPTGRQQSAVIPLLMRAQDQDGWVSRATIETIADMLGMAYIRVLEVATFYTQFQLQPVGRNAHIQVCGTTPCMLRGAGDLIALCKSKIHHDPQHLNADGTMSWEEVECAGACVNAPMVTIYHDTYEDLTAERFEEIVDAFAAGKGDTIKPGPQVDRLYSSAAGGQTTLLIKPTAKREKFIPPAPPAEAAAAPAPTVAAKPKAVVAESAPAIKGTPESAKVSTGKAESERKAADVAAKANGKPNKAMRPAATGAESVAGKVDGGKAVGKTPKAMSVAAPKTSGKAVAPKAKTAQANPAAKKGGAKALFKAPAGAADDLKLISGVGPVLEGKLNALGITQWSQVAAFTNDEIAKVDDALSFKGRITRDDWIKQAAALAKGGEAEYVRVFGKKPR